MAWIDELRSRLMKGPWRQAAAGVFALVAALLFTTLSVGPYDALRERTFDAMLSRLVPALPASRVVVVDIDRTSLERGGAWPWSREQLAGLLGDVLEGGPSAVGFDILIDGADERSPAALARRLAELTGSQAAKDLAGTLVDGDERLATVMRAGAVVLGLVLDPERPSELAASTPVLVQGGSDVSGIWRANGVAGPPSGVANAAAGLGVLALAGDADGRVRRVPLFTFSDAQLRPGFALETARVAQKASAYVLAAGNNLRVGELHFPIGSDAALRLVPANVGNIVGRSIPATEVGSSVARQRLAGSIVLIGSSAPELGGLRPASGGALVPSVHLQAAALEQILARLNPRRPLAIEPLEIGALIAAALAGLAAALFWSPRRAVLVMLGVALAWVTGAAGALRGWQMLIDPIAVPVAALASVTLTALLVAAAARQREAALRQRFEQHLAPELVSRLVENPGLLKLAGETREVTILFTDVEGFTAMTERSDPLTLIRVLDSYIDEMSAIIVAHGGMVEKIVGDGFHGLFNAPLDLPGHADKAVACARAIAQFSQEFAAEAEPASIGFGRTRVGIETGPVIVGDVGGGTRLDYTAYGNAMNTAARLEAANKDLGSAICIGPATAAALTDKALLRPLGPLVVRGRSEVMAVFDIWPGDMTARQRERYERAMATWRTSPTRAIELLVELAAERPGDKVIPGVIERLRTQEAR